MWKDTIPVGKTLLIVSKGLAPYRVRYYAETAKALLPGGWRVLLAIAENGARDHPWADPGGGADGVQIVPVGGRFWPMFRRIPFGARLLPVELAMPSFALCRLLNRENPDIVWTHEYSPFCVLASGWAKLRRKVSLLSTDLGDHPPPYSCTARQLARQKRLSPLYDAVIAQTMEATRRSQPAGAPVLFAPHAISTAEYVPDPARPSGRFRFLFTGALNSRKGIDRVIAAARLVHAQGHNFEMRVLGSGTLSGWLAEQADPWLSIGGFVEGEALRREYRSADAYVLPTREDTYAVTVHEAAASGLPMIVGRSAGAVETLVHAGISGYPIDADNVQELADKMLALLKNVDNAVTMGAQARSLAERYDVEKLGRETAGFIEGLCAKR